MTRRRYLAPLAGFVLGTQFAAKSLQPSLMPRSAIDQGLTMAGSFATGYVVGSTGAHIVGILPILSGSGVLRLAGMATRFIPTPESADGSVDEATSESAAWFDAGTDALSSVAFADSMTSHAGAGASAAASVGFAAATAIEAKNAIEEPSANNVDAKYLATAVGTAIGATMTVAAIAGATKLSGVALKKATGSTGFQASVLQTIGTVGAAAAVAFGAKAFASKGIAAIAAGNRAVEIAYAEHPSVETVSGGVGSNISFDSLGLQGRRLVSEVTTATEIESVMAEPQRKQPVRVYVGVESAASIQERVDLAIEELDRTGGFDRSTIVAASPAGTGYVNYIATEACELMARGDVATVAVQYGSLPSMLSMNKVEDASNLYAALISRLRSEIEDRNLGCALLGYGESLGALTGQNGVVQARDSSGSSPIDGALWVGTPYGSALFNDLTKVGGVPVFDRPEQLVSFVDDGNTVPQTALLNHDNDPVTKFTPSMFYQMPDWFKESDRGRGVSPSQRWFPGVAFWQGLIDTKNAATVVPGQFGSTGHDYRADLATFIMLTFGFSDVDAGQLARIEEQLRSSEIERSQNIEEGKISSS